MKRPPKDGIDFLVRHGFPPARIMDCHPVLQGTELGRLAGSFGCAHNIHHRFAATADGHGFASSAALISSGSRFFALATLTFILFMIAIPDSYSR